MLELHKEVERKQVSLAKLEDQNESEACILIGELEN